MPTADYKTKDGKRVSGVTTIISGNLGWNKQALMYWSWSEGRDGRDFRETSQKAADAGTIAHAMIEADLHGKEFKSDAPKEILDKAETSFLAYLEFKDVVGLSPIATELPLVSEEWKYGGTIDVAIIKKYPAILDLKTSNGVYADHLIQVAAYGKLWDENNPEMPIQAYYILQLGKEDGSFHYHYWPELNDEFEAFKCLLTLHRLKKTIK
jgi:hypothetical protein